MASRNIVTPPKLEAARRVVDDTLKRMHAGEMGLVEGAEFLYWNVHINVGEEKPDTEFVGDAFGLEHIL